MSSADLCRGKAAFSGHDAARRVADRPTRGVASNRQPYRCPHCGQWHLGSAVAPRALRKGGAATFKRKDRYAFDEQDHLDAHDDAPGYDGE